MKYWKPLEFLIDNEDCFLVVTLDSHGFFTMEIVENVKKAK